MKRTTLVLDDDLLQQLKEKAVRTGQSIKDTVNSLLRSVLAKPRTPRKKFQLKWKTYRGTLLPGVHLDDRDALFNLMDER